MGVVGVEGVEGVRGVGRHRLDPHSKLHQAGAGTGKAYYANFASLASQPPLK